MAPAMYPSAKKKLLDGDIDYLVDTIKVALVTSAYNSAHDFYNDLTGVCGTDQTLANKTTTDGVFYADPSAWTGLTGTAIVGAVVYKDTGVAGTSPVIAYIDNVSSFPLTLTSGAFGINWGSYIFQLT